MVPGVLSFIEYCFSDASVDHIYYGGGLKKLFINNLLGSVIAGLEKHLLDALKPYPDIISPTPFKETEALCR